MGKTAIISGGIAKPRMMIVTLVITLCFFFFLGVPNNQAASFPPLFGIQDSKLNYTPSLRPLTKDIGVKWAREYILWSIVEPVQGAYQWDRYDALFLDYHNLGITVIALLGGNPSWAAPKPYGPVYPAYQEDFKRFVSALVERYDGDGMNDAPGSPVVRFFEFFNEPDLNTEEFGYASELWGLWGGKGAEYAAMLKSVYAPIKSANPEARVVFGGLALEDIGKDSKGNPIFDPNFLDSVLSAGGGEHFDVMNFHYYSPFASVWSVWGADVLGKTNYVRNKLSSYGITKPIFITEAGEWSKANRSEELQARYVVKLFARGLAGDIKSVIWYIFEDYDCSPSATDGTRGLLRCDGTEKPSYQVYRTTSNLLGDAAYVGKVPDAGEGYIFSREGVEYIYVLWDDAGTRQITLPVRSNEVTRISKSGLNEALPVSAQGTVTLTIGPDPVFLKFSLSRLYLKTGWNLVALPFLNGDSSTAGIFSPLSGDYERIYAYKGCDLPDPWKMHDPLAPSWANDLKTISPDLGIWVKMKKAASLPISGDLPSSLGIPLCKGWNLIGYPGERAQPVTEALSSISGKYERVYAYRAEDAADPWKMHDPLAPTWANDLIVLESGWGYWIKVKENCTLIVNHE